MAPIAAASQQIDKQQSTELVRIMIVTSFSHVLWFRRVFPRMRYIFKTCDPADPSTSYDEFVYGPKSGSTEDLDPAAGLISCAIVPRNINADADKFLNHLENGVKEALEIGSLSKLQLSFHLLDKQTPSTDNLIESYTLGFDYKNGISLAEITAEDRDSIIGSSSFAIGDVKEQMESLLSELNHLLLSSNSDRRAKRLSLPKSFRMLLSMKYVSVDGYQPAGFHTGNDELLALIDESPMDLQMMMTTGHHSVLTGIVQNEGQATPEEEEPQLFYGISKPLKSGTIIQQTSQPNVVQVLDPIESQSQSQSMMAKEIDTMGVSRIGDFNTQFIESSPMTTQQPSLDTPSVQPQSASAISAHNVSHHVKQSQPTQSQDNSSIQADRFNVCECQDGSTKAKSQLEMTQDNKLMCAICDGHRHPQCYGYGGAVELESFTCYTCLESQFPDQKAQIQMAKSLCIKRRTLSHILEEVASVSIQPVAQYLNCSAKKAGDVLNELEREGYIQNTAAKNRKKLFVFTGQRRKANKQYFDPNTGIEGLVATTTASHAEKEKLSKLPVSQKNARKKIGNESKRTEKQPRVFHAPNHVITADDVSTQGTPSPHSRSALRPDSSTPVTPTSSKIMAIKPVADHGKKRKADAKPDATPARRPRVAHGTPWSMRYQ